MRHGLTCPPLLRAVGPRKGWIGRWDSTIGSAVFASVPHPSIMSTSTFPTLFRLSSISSYDPLITRIYTAPTSAAIRGDWGLKSSLPPARTTRPRSRYIKVSSLDDESIGCDWASGEKEARFVERWGNGRAGWMGVGEFQERQQERGSLNNSAWRSGRDKTVQKSDLSYSTERREESYIPDIEGMSEKRFEAYLEEIRSRRVELEAKIAAERKEGFKGLVHHYKEGMNQSEPMDFIAETTTSKMLSPDSSAIHPRAHKRGGLAYSTISPFERMASPLCSVPGRGFNPVSHQDHSDNRASKTLQHGRAFKDSKNQGSVVGIGGLLASTKSIGSIHASSGAVDSSDWSGQDLQQGTGKFRVTQARIRAFPRVVASSATSTHRDINPYDAVGFDNLRDRVRRISPLEKAAFEVDVRPDFGTAEPEVGSVEWVKGDRVAQSRPSDVLSLGSSLDEPAYNMRRGLKGQQTQKSTKTDVATLIGLLNKMNRPKIPTPTESSTVASTRTYLA
jgi:hypothetical protein